MLLAIVLLVIFKVQINSMMTKYIMALLWPVTPLNYFAMARVLLRDAPPRHIFALFMRNSVTMTTNDVIHMIIWRGVYRTFSQLVNRS